jgi:hypothetical protein
MDMMRWEEKHNVKSNTTDNFQYHSYQRQTQNYLSTIKI